MPPAPLLPPPAGAMLVLVSVGTADGDCEGVGVVGGGLLGEAGVVGDGDTVLGVADGEGLDGDGDEVGPVGTGDGVDDGRGEGHPGAGDWLEGVADGTDTGPGVVCVPGRLTVVATAPPEAEPAPPAVEAGVGQTGWINVLPGSDRGGTLPTPARVAGPGLCVPPTLLVVPPPELPPPLAPASGWTTSFPPVNTVELTWTRAERSGGTATAITASEAAAARPPARRTHPSRVGRTARGNSAAQRRQVASRKFSGWVAQAQ
jgi:hypothetical protein